MPCHNDQFTVADIPDLTGYVVIVTGGTLSFLPARSMSIFSLFPNNTPNNTLQETAASATRQPFNSPSAMLAFISPAAQKSASTKQSKKCRELQDRCS